MAQWSRARATLPEDCRIIKIKMWLPELIKSAVITYLNLFNLLEINIQYNIQCERERIYPNIKYSINGGHD